MLATLAHLIQRNALLQADAFGVGNRLREWRAHRAETLFHGLAWLALLLVMLGCAFSAARQVPLTSLVAVLRWGMAVWALATMVGFLFGAAQQRQDRRAFAQSWLGVAPLTRSQLTLAHSLRLALRLLLTLGGALLLVFVCLRDRLDAEVPSLLGLQTQASLLFFVAAILGSAVAAQRDPPTRRQRQLQPRPQRVHRQHVSGAELRPLALWVFAVWREYLRGTYLAWPLLLILMLVPIGSPVGAVVLGLLCWLSVLAAIALARAQAEVISQSATWLRCTPLPFARFALALCLRPALAFACVVAVGAVLLGLLGVSIAALPAFWLAALLLFANATGIALQCRYAPSRQRLLLVIDALLLALFAQLALPLIYPLAMMLALLHWRRAAVRR